MRNLFFYALVLAALYLAAVYRSPAPVLVPPTGELDVRDLGSGAVPPPSVRDAVIHVQLGEATSSSGTAFAVGPGQWMSARHVVENCDRVFLLTENGNWRGGYVLAQTQISGSSDLAILTADWLKQAFPLAATGDLQRNQSAFIVGFPQGKAGELHGKLLGRAQAVFAARRRMSEPVLVWAETGRSGGFTGSVGGISGGPAFDAVGQVIGVAVAETMRRGRIYTAAPRSITRAAANWDVVPQITQTAGVFSRSNFEEQGNYLRAVGRVAQVVCVVD